MPESFEVVTQSRVHFLIRQPSCLRHFNVFTLNRFKRGMVLYCTFAIKYAYRTFAIDEICNSEELNGCFHSF